MSTWLEQLNPNTLAMLLVAIMQAVNLFYTRRTEKNTNSIKDELVASVSREQHAAGEEKGRLAGEKKAAALVESARRRKGR